MTAPTELAEIAGNLTAGERKIILSTAPGDRRLFYAVSGRPRASSFAKGLIASAPLYAGETSARFCLTPLGVALRQHLQGNGGEG